MYLEICLALAPALPQFPLQAWALSSPGAWHPFGEGLVSKGWGDFGKEHCPGAEQGGSLINPLIMCSQRSSLWVQCWASPGRCCWCLTLVISGVFMV